MSRPGFGEGVLLALGLALGAGLLHGLIGMVAGPGNALDWTGLCAAFGYLLYLLARSPERAGRTVLVAGWLLVTCVVWLLLPDRWIQTLVQLGMLWAVRTLQFQRGVLGALLDLGLWILGLAAGAWALERTGSLFLAVWSLLLVQALFGAMPAAFPRRGAGSPLADPFETAERAAQRALRRPFTR